MSRINIATGILRHVKRLLHVNSQIPRSAPRKVGFRLSLVPRDVLEMETGGASVIILCRNLIEDILKRPALASNRLHFNSALQQQPGPARIKRPRILHPYIQKSRIPVQIKSQQHAFIKKPSRQFLRRIAQNRKLLGPILQIAANFFLTA